MYELLSSKKYLEFVVKNRIAIFIFTFFVFTISIFNINMNLLAKNENQFWVQNISQKNIENQKYISKLTVHVDIDKQAINNVKDLEVKLNKHFKTDSIFNQKFWYNDNSGEGSESLSVITSKNMDYSKLEKFINTFEDKTNIYVDKEHLYIYIYSDKKLVLDDIKKYTNLNISIDNMEQSYMSNFEIIIYSAAVLLLIFVLFTYTFKHIIAGISSISIIFLTSIISISIIQIIMPSYLLHITNILLLISISLLDYLYFYYRWHNTQYNKNSIEALEQSLNRNVIPAIMTALITIISLVSIYSIGSNTIKAITLSIILPSVVGLILNLIFLPALLSYFTIKNTDILLNDIYNKLSEKMVDYNKKIINIAIAASVIFILFMLFEYNEKKDYLFNSNSNSVLEYSLQTDKKNIDQLIFNYKLEEELKSKFPDIKNIKSVSQDLNDITKITNNEKLNTQNINEAIFFFELYGMDKDLDNIKSKIILKENSLMKTSIIFYINNKNIDGLLFTDKDSQISDSKFNQIKYLMYSLLIDLVLLSIIISITFRKPIMITGSLFVNTLPLLGFALLLHIYKLPLTIEVFIAMAVSVAMSSNTTIHFMYSYLRNRYYKQSQVKSLKMTILFSGTPLLISTIVLFFTFVILILSGMPELEKIGTYTAVLLLLGMLINMLILPVIILNSDKDNF
jgi:predicted RND superfamily exporter protein